jgi:DNA polymerase III subunit delta'
MARAPRAATVDSEPIPEADRLPGWPHPRETHALFGHNAGEAVLADAIASRRLHHAWLITGEEGIGKATFAYRAARFLLAQDEELAGVSLLTLDQTSIAAGPSSLALPEDHKTYRLVTNLAHPGLLIIRRAWDTSSKKFKQSIAVDDVRQLRHFLQRTSVTPWRAVIVDAADDLNQNSANALLKSLEEPPPRTVFFLVAASPGGLLPTIRSRCRTLRLEPLDTDGLAKAVTAACNVAGRDMPDAMQMARLYALAKGRPRRVLQLIDGGGLALFELLLVLLSSLPRMDRAVLHRLIAQTRDAEAHAMAFDLLEEALANTIRASTERAEPDRNFPQLGVFARLVTPDSLADWSELWEKARLARSETERLNLDKAALTLTVFEEIQRTARQVAQRAH